MDRLRRSILSGRAMIAFQVSRRRRSTYQRNKADPSRLRRFGVASLGRRHGKLHQDAISAPADGGLLHAPLGKDVNAE